MKKTLIAAMLLVALASTASMAQASTFHFGRLAFLNHTSPSHHHTGR
ncbi:MULTISPECIES: hypothetical protein [Pirellulaceae]|nr:MULTISPECIES: hypothetical protein [Pirellulaceae]